jgi:diacylglycerol kinase family enzyme
VPQLRYHILLNAKAGGVGRVDATAQRLADLFAARGDIVRIDADHQRPFPERLRDAALSPADVLVAAGGDGTASALAGVALATGKPLAVLPLGTANLLARDLSIPLNIDNWFTALDTMAYRSIDLGDVNGRIFLHKVVIGAIPGIAAAREHLRGRTDLASKLGFAVHFIDRLSSVRRFAAEITPDSGEPHIERLQSVAVVNNDYAEGVGQVFTRPRLDAGRLSLYILRHLSIADALRLAVGMVMGAWRNDDVLEIENVRSVTIRTRWPRVRAMVDGEIETLRSPMAFTIRPLALTVLAPPAAALERAAPADTAVVVAGA